MYAKRSLTSRMSFPLLSCPHKYSCFEYVVVSRPSASRSETTAEADLMARLILSVSAGLCIVATCCRLQKYDEGQIQLLINVDSAESPERQAAIGSRLLAVHKSRSPTHMVCCRLPESCMVALTCFNPSLS